MKKASTIILLLLLAGTLIFADKGKSVRRFNASLSGDQALPPVDSWSQAQAMFWLSKDESTLSFRLIVEKIENVISAHLHLGAKSESGPEIVELYSGPVVEGTAEGVLVEGTITAADLAGPLKENSLSVLVGKIEAGKVYIDIHTKANESGEIRGQVE